MTDATRSPRYAEVLLDLAARPGTLALLPLWKALPRPDRERALVLALEREGAGWFRRYLADALGRKLSGFRPETLMHWSAGQLAAESVRRGVDRDGVLRQALVALHFPERRHLQIAFLDRLGISHEDGALEPGALPAPAAPPERLAEAAAALLDRYPGDEALVYLLTIRVLEPRAWAGLDPWFVRFAGMERPAEAAAPSPVPSPAVPGAPEPAEPAPEVPAAGPGTATQRLEGRGPGPRAGLAGPAADLAPLTVLDSQVTLAIVDAAAEVHGALTPEGVDALVEELVRLNGRRHQSFYHVGFRDALFEHPPAGHLPAENEARRLWYSAGYVTGLRRRGRDSEIVRLYDTYPSVRHLGRRGLGAYGAGGPHVFTALCQAGRFAEAAAFVSATAVEESERFEEALLEQATALLRREEAALAGQMFGTLWQGLADRKAAGGQVKERNWADVRRRWAHCLRSRGNLEAGRDLLEEVLDDPDPNNRAAVLTDLGLCDAGFGRLYELRYPEKREDVPALSARLAQGLARFETAAAIEADRAAHARYVLGFLALLEGRAGEAVPHLAQALALFESIPAVYSGGGLLWRARLHLALAICQALVEPQRFGQAARWIADAIRDGEPVPDYVLQEALDTLSLADNDAARRAAEAILEAAGENRLDVLANSEASRGSQAIADALVRRARNPHRALAQRAEDWHRALPALLQAGRVDEAAEGLDVLEEAACEGAGVGEFLAILEAPARYRPAWDLADAEWARVRLLESRGDYVAAAAVLTSAFHRVLASDRWHRLAEGAEYLERLEGYPPDAVAGLAALRARYEALAAQEREGALEDLAPATARPLTVLVVGGNETQQRQQGWIEEELRRRHAWIAARFIYTGWGSNWNGYVAEVERALATVDAVVLHRFMRTGLGRAVRKRLGETPWCGCGAPGREVVLRSIVRAAAMARVRRAQEAG